MTVDIPAIRLRTVVERPVREDGEYVLYWMTAARRTRWNFALDRAAHWAHRLQQPLVVLEALRTGYRWASDRLHRFILEGMVSNAAGLRDAPVTYYPYVEPVAGAGSGLLEALARRASLVVTDDFPCFFLPRMVDAAERQIDVRLERVDSNGLLPMRAAEAVYPTAYAFRRFLQRTLPEHLPQRPCDDILASIQLAAPPRLDERILQRWPQADLSRWLDDPQALAPLPIDHEVGPAIDQGGQDAGRLRLEQFLDRRLVDYAQSRNAPEEEATSGLSPYLHFGHISAHAVFDAIVTRERWTIERLTDGARGQREGWWSMSPPAEAYLDQLVTWRELGYNFCVHRDDYDRFESLPDWARRTLEQHAQDPRPQLYELAEFEQSATHDPLWNAAQRQLVREGRMHNYLRMLWGKKILEWSPSPAEALEVMIELNNKYALDGRNPNSYSGIFWCLGRYDRAWGPERPIYGKVRYMTSANTARKYPVAGYLEKYGA